jgi:hypothetical protein
VSPNTAFDYATPYDIMVGLWTVQKISYGPRGEYGESTPSFVAVYWKKRHKLMHFRETEPDTTNSSKRCIHRAVFKLEFDLNVEGKYSHGKSSTGVKISGTETRPDVYHFHLKDEGGDWYNNHYLISPNERHVLGPYVEKNGKIEWIVAQTLTRVSYDVPMKYKRGLHRSGK